jgi:hypothetical protein
LELAHIADCISNIRFERPSVAAILQNNPPGANGIPAGTALADFPGGPLVNEPFLMLEKDESQILLQFLNNAWGIRKAERIAASAQSVEFQTDTGPLSIKVMHPVLVLESKVSMAGKRARKLQQDIKHARMALLFVREYILDTAKQNAREAIRLCKAVFEIESSDGLGLFRELKVACEEAIPWDKLKENVKIRRFLDQTAAPRLAELRKRRAGR